MAKPFIDRFAYSVVVARGGSDTPPPLLDSIPHRCPQMQRPVVGGWESRLARTVGRLCYGAIDLRLRCPVLTVEGGGACSSDP